MARLDEFLAHNIDGYLAWDLNAMSRPDEHGRGVSYPILMAASSGIEFLGALLSQQPFQSRGQSKAYFMSYWANHLYPSPSPNVAFGAVAYELARCGVAHSFLLKGTMRVGRNMPHLHLKNDAAGNFIVDAVQLGIDLMSSYRNRVKPILTDGTRAAERAQMESRLNEMEIAYAGEAAKHASVLGAASTSSVFTHVGSAPPVGTPAVSSSVSSTPPTGRSGPTP